MKTVIVLALVALLVPGILGLPLGDSLLKRLTRDVKEEPTEPPAPKKPEDSMIGHQEPFDEDQTPETFQGDMMLTDDQRRKIEEAINDEKAGRKKRKAVDNENTRWPHKIVPYEITASSINDAAKIREAMDHWEQHTCLRFEPRTSSHASQLGHNTYLSFIRGNGCWSYVGKVSNEPSGEQQISIGSGCASLGIIAHEIGHAIGFHHEQSRPDRDDYIVVHYDNIEPRYHRQFDKYSWNQVTTRDVDYDIGSVMHYGSYGFSRNGQRTITTIDPLQRYLLGNRNGLRAADVELANLIYECDNACVGTDQCQNGGYRDINCNCVCPPGYSGNLCQEGDGSTITPPCIQRLTELQGEITSPNYPSNYDNNQDCLYLIEGPSGSTIELTFVDMNIENENLCRYDAVEVHKDDIHNDGEKFCGNILPPNQISSSNQMLVSFTSDYSVTGRGFKATYVINGVTTTEAPTTNPPVVGTCGGNFDGNQGSLASPNYPANYDNNHQCVYVIEVDADRRVELTFADFSLENQNTCRWDALEIDLGDGIKVPMMMCGSEYPSTSLVSIGNKMELRFTSDRSVTDRGFRADYRAIEL